MASEKKQHGGARKGAGRKPAQSDKKTVSMRVPLEDKERLERLVKLTGDTQVEVFADALKAYEKQLKSGA